MTHPIIPCLWFDKEAKEAVDFYTTVFKDSKVTSISYYGKEGYEFHGMEEGTVLSIEFQLNGQSYSALNGGPLFNFTEAVSFQVFCDTQEEIDYYWEKLASEGGEESYCGWLKDKFGLSWQIVPSILESLMKDPERGGRVVNAFMQMKKFEIEKLLHA